MKFNVCACNKESYLRNAGAERRPDRTGQDRRRTQDFVSRLRHERQHGAGGTRRARRVETVAAAYPGGDERPGVGAQPRLPQVRQDRRRHLGQLPPARRGDRLSHPGAHGAELSHALSPGGRPGEFRLDRWVPAGGHALHRGAHELAGDRIAGRSGQGYGRSRQQLRRNPR